MPPYEPRWCQRGIPYYGAFVVPQEFGSQIDNATPEYALIAFAVFYLICVGINWWYHLGPKAEYQNP